MDIFQRAKVVKLRSHHHGKYLVASENKKGVRLQRNGSCEQAKWTVERTIFGLRFRSFYGLCLTAVDGQVVQKEPSLCWPDLFMRWTAIGGEGACAMLMAWDEKFLRANDQGSSVTHSLPSRSATLNLMLWHVDVVEVDTVPTFENLEAVKFIIIGLLLLWYGRDMILVVLNLVNKNLGGTSSRKKN